MNQRKLNEIQTAKLKKLLEYAYNNVAYYRRLFNQVRIIPDDIKTVEDIQKIPITTRADIRNAPPSEVLSKTAKINRCIKFTTSGTTDVPLDIFFSRNEEIMQGLLHFRMLFANGYKIQDKVAVLTHPQFIARKKKKYILQRLGIFDMEFMSILQSPKELLEILLEIEPDIIKGYTPVIKAIALEMRAKNIKAIHPHSVFCTAEFLTKDDRNFISSIFGAEVIDYYSSTECGLIAWECRQHIGYHINSDSLIVEVMHNGKKCSPGEAGEVIITNLNSYTMPFIRYKTGDVAILSDTLCPCGRSLPLIKAIIERSQIKHLLINQNHRYSDLPPKKWTQ